MQILIAPAHYLFSDRVGSEPLWAVELVETLGKRIDRLDVIVGVNDTQREFSSNIHIHALFSNRSPLIWKELYRKVIFYFLVTLKGLQLLKDHKYTAIHHILPFSLASFNPLLLICHRFYPQTMTVIGPAQAPYQNHDIHDIDLVLLGRKVNKIVMFPVEILVLILSRLMIFPVKYLITHVNYFVCVSQSSLSYYRTFRSLPIIVIPPVIHPLERVLGYSTKRGQLLFSGSLVNRKGVDVLLHAMQIVIKQYPSAKLNILGSGPELVNLKNICRQLKISKSVKFAGNVNRNEIAHFYSEAQLLCVPSREDSYPTVIIEGLSLGLPIVASDIGSIREMVGSAGLLVAKDDHLALANAIIKILENKSLNLTLKKNSINRYNSYYSPIAVSGSYLRVYQGK